MTTALEKVLAATGKAPAPQPEDMAAELVLAALTGAQELTELLLADSDDEDEDDEEEGGGGHAGHPTYKKLVSKVGPAKAAAMCAQADKKVAATALSRSVTVALSGLTAASGDWVERTSLDTRALALAGKTSEGGPKKPYGNVTYADPGHQEDGKKRYPVDTPEHVRAALSYIRHKKNAAKYSPEHLASIRAKIKSAAKKHGIDVGEDQDEEKVAATYLALAAKKPAGPPQAFHHGPFNGVHAHGHYTQDIHEHEHAHNGDSMHDRHPHGSMPPQFGESEY